MPNIGIAELDVVRDGERSIVARQFGRSPLQVHRPLYLDGAAHPTVYLRSPSSGLLDGDEHRINVAVSSGACLELRTQAACVVYPGASQQTLTVNVADNGKFVFRPHPFILHKGARLQQRVRINLSETSQLIFSDSWCAGRLAMEEAWQFDEFDNTVEIFLERKLIYRDRYQIRPSETNPTHRFICDDYRVFETLHLYRCNHSGIENCDVQWQSTRGDCTIIRSMRKN
jgi:urease accessory protein